MITPQSVAVEGIGFGPLHIAVRGFATGADAAPFRALWKQAGSVAHVFTHFELELTVYRGYVDAAPPPGHWWSKDLAGEALPNLMRKAIEVALPGSSKKAPAKSAKRKT